MATRGIARAIRNHPRGTSRFWNHRRMPAVAEKLSRAPRSWTNQGEQARRRSPTTAKTDRPSIRLPNATPPPSKVAIPAARTAEAARHRQTKAQTAGMANRASSAVPQNRAKRDHPEDQPDMVSRHRRQVGQPAGKRLPLPRQSRPIAFRRPNKNQLPVHLGSRTASAGSCMASPCIQRRPGHTRHGWPFEQTDPGQLEHPLPWLPIGDLVKIPFMGLVGRWALGPPLDRTWNQPPIPLDDPFLPVWSRTVGPVPGGHARNTSRNKPDDGGGFRSSI